MYTPAPPGAASRPIHRLARLLAVLLCLGMPAIFTVRPAFAASFVVDSGADAAADGVCGVTAGDCTLRDAVALAATSPGADTITFSVATVTLVAAQGTLTINQDLTITGDATNKTQIVAPTGLRAITVTGGPVTLSNLYINGNFAGSGLSNSAAAPNGLTLNNIQISNTAGGGAATGGAIANGGSLTLTGGTFTVNGAASGGGAIANDTGATMNLTNMAISGSSSSIGGAVMNAGTLTASTCLVSGSSTSSGAGGGFLNTDGSATFTNCTFSGNTADGPTGAPRNGGGIAVTGGTVTLNSSTVASNTAKDNGGGISGNITMKATLVASNTAPTATDISGTVTSQGYNLVGNTGGTTISGTTTGNITSVNARIATLAAYGASGGLQTHALLPGSPAIDAVPAAECPANDQRSIARAVTSGASFASTPCDIGAFESRGFTVSVTSGSGQSTTAGTPFGTTIVLQLASANSEPTGSGALTWTGPASGAGIIPQTGTIAAATDGSVEFNFFNANATAGSYSVSFGGKGIATPASVSLTNTAAPTAGYSSSPAPGAVNVGTFTVGQQGSASIIVSETGSAALNITSAVLSGTNASEFSVSPTSFTIADGAAAQTVTVSCTPAAAGARTATLTVTHNAAGSPAVYSLTCTGSLTALPGYSSSPAPGSTLNIGPSAVGVTATTTLQVSESGAAALTISSAVVSGADAAMFSVSPTSFTIADGGAAQAVTVSCTPTSVGTHTATLTITHNASGSTAVYTLSCSSLGVFLPLVGN